MKLPALLPALLCTLAMAGCEQKSAAPPAAAPQPAAGAVPQPSSAAQSVPQQLPALYSGTLPCADCPGIRFDLDLRANHVYVLRMTYLERDTSVDDIGQWSIQEDEVLTLTGSGERPSAWAIRDVDTLSKLDIEGKPIESNLNYTIVRQPDYTALEPHLTMRGLYRYMADAAQFEECLTGLKLPVAMEGDNVALQTAYATVRREPGAAVLASVEGRIAPRPAMEGDRTVDMLVVDRFVRFWPNESCGARGVTHDLVSTRWVLTRLNDEPVDVSKLQREPFIALEGNEHRVFGNGSCNRVVGAYETEGERITFKQLALTRMACPNMDFEAAFGKALNAATRWKISGAHLELFDADGKVVARFEERNL
ncbi:MAG TPA: META domain-containing protein [Povalibacter sp.]|uniref:META domain-containing protein n=1 Tax=Povalibacter sp. TaxID=1962978 RepID=UPI002C9A5F25|nr:META domain-containing protein [Povalibacter sp.]HMN45806.1 META domain-containing protein [Povalibacter sp.]